MDHVKFVRKMDRVRKLILPNSIKSAAGINKSSILVMDIDDAGLIRITRDDDKNALKIDDSNSVGIPQFWAAKYDFKENDAFDIWTENAVICIKKVTPVCVFTGETENLVEYKGKWVSKKALDDLNKIN